MSSYLGKVFQIHLQFSPSSALQCRLECDSGYSTARTPLITCVNGKYEKGCHNLHNSDNKSLKGDLTVTQFQMKATNVQNEMYSAKHSNFSYRSRGRYFPRKFEII